MLLQNAKTKAINQIATRFILFTKNKLAWAVACTTIGHRGWLLRTDMTVRSLAVGCHRNENKNQHARKWFYPGCHARLSSPTNDERTYISFMVTLVCIKIAFHSQRQPCDSVAGLYTIFSLLCTSVKWTTNERLRRKHAYKFPFLNKRRSSCEHVMRWITGDRMSKGKCSFLVTHECPFISIVQRTFWQLLTTICSIVVFMSVILNIEQVQYEHSYSVFRHYFWVL